MLTPELTTAYVNILREELIPATGCTEPIAIAYGAARLRETLGQAPEKILAEVSAGLGEAMVGINKDEIEKLEGIRMAERGI